jgi:hypothetical protein
MTLIRLPNQAMCLSEFLRQLNAFHDCSELFFVHCSESGAFELLMRLQAKLSERVVLREVYTKHEYAGDSQHKENLFKCDGR